MKLGKIYQASDFEANIYALWQKRQSFKADPSSQKPHFSISMPPPNETGTLHVGHSLFITIQDILCRSARQQGKDVLWLPGTDHAALAVNALMEKQLSQEGTTKNKIGRQEFLRRTKEFVANNRGSMIDQMKAVGASADWSRLRYTLDPALNRCVNEVFIKMYKDELIYRGHRIVNWDPALETNISDDEVLYEERDATLYTFQFGPFQISTTRPETKFADKYVVVHPDDHRYKKYKDRQTFEVEWINGKVQATVIKDQSIDMSFGTGAMTITPWHSLIDFEIAERHNLDKQQIIDFHGRLLPIAEEFSGMTIDEARPKIIAKLKNKGLIIKEDDTYVHKIAINERGRGVIEPQIRLQWFIDVNKKAIAWKGKTFTFKQVLQSVIKDEDIKIVPKHFENEYFHWINNLRDWCISRQIWWGHRIPVWYRQDTDGREEIRVGIEKPKDTSEGWHDWQQDPDTLDTWFSSALWTWSTLIDPSLAEDLSLNLDGLLKKSQDFKVYHPTTIMESGWDILFFWIARMIMTTTYATGQVPFKTVYLHGLVRTESGQKMSKSRPESSINPMEVIKEYGADALRLSLIQGVAAGNDLRLSKARIISNRNFCNKLWNIARYIEDNIADQKLLEQPQFNNIADHWIIKRLAECQNKITANIDNFRFSEAYDNLYHYIWNDLADWYLEVSKLTVNKSLLHYVLVNTLIMAHPFTPFITETIWQTISTEEDIVLAEKQITKIITFDSIKATNFDELKNVISECRFIIKTLQASDVTLYHQNINILKENSNLIIRLAGLKAVEEVNDGQGIYLKNTKYRCWLDIDTTTANDYMQQLDLRLDKQRKIIEGLKKRLANKEYLHKAPKTLVHETKEQLVAAENLIEELEFEKQKFKS